MRLAKPHVLERRRYNMKTKIFWWLRLTVVLVVLLLGGMVFVTRASAGSTETRFRWDIGSIDFTTGTINSGGIASATAIGCSQIPRTGHGSLVLGGGAGDHGAMRAGT